MSWVAEYVDVRVPHSVLYVAMRREGIRYARSGYFHVVRRDHVRFGGRGGWGRDVL
jgi:hypothetical protein